MRSERRNPTLLRRRAGGASRPAKAAIMGSTGRGRALGVGGTANAPSRSWQRPIRPARVPAIPWGGSSACISRVWGQRRPRGGGVRPRPVPPARGGYRTPGSAGSGSMRCSGRSTGSAAGWIAWRWVRRPGRASVRDFAWTRSGSLIAWLHRRVRGCRMRQMRWGRLRREKRKRRRFARRRWLLVTTVILRTSAPCSMFWRDGGSVAWEKRLIRRAACRGRTAESARQSPGARRVLGRC